MFAVGHMSIAYLITRGLKRDRLQSMSIPLVWTAALLPDIDLLIPGINHMGPTHSIIFAIAIFLPLFLLKGKEATPYFLAYASHTALGDLITNKGIWFLWPLTRRRLQIPLPVTCKTTFSANLELTLFALFLLTYILTKDYANEHYSNTTRPLTLIPITALLVPLVFGFPIPVPLRLIPPHLAFTAIALQPYYPESWRTQLTKLSKKQNPARS
jgi:membrane-bound metal-dependent hydrolase YbcI (DUF457 family)